MSGCEEKPLLLVILGPTASGKSTLALQAAPDLRGEIVNCDSMQMVRHLSVGTAKPCPAEMARVPHHLFDIVEPHEFFSAGAYMFRAREVCRKIAGRGATPIVVGGTGLYLRALLKGIFAGPGRSPELRQRLQRIGKRRGSPSLHRILAARDPETAAEIMPGDLIRVVRALEVSILTGDRLSRLKQQTEPLTDFRVLKVGLLIPRLELYSRINRRVEGMFKSGLVDEVRALLEMGYPRNAKAFEAIGYRQALGVLLGELSIQQAIEITQRNTRRYAKRQMTWFRREEDVNWLKVPGEDMSALGLLDGILASGRRADGI